MPDELLMHFLILNERIDSDEFQQERKARYEMLAAAQKYYEGRHRRFLKVRKGEKDHNVIINLCKSIVKKSAAWLFGDFESGETIKFTIKEADIPESEDGQAENITDDEADDTESPDSEVDPGEQWIEDVYRKNGGGQFFMRMARRGGVSGHVFVKVLPKGDPDNDLDVPKLVLQKSNMISVLRREDDSDSAEAYVIEWVEKRQIISENTSLGDVTVRQIITSIDGEWWIAQFNDRGRAQDAKWDIEAGPDRWPYNWCPIIDWQNLSNDFYYGESDLEDLPEINDSINFTVSNINKILYTHGHPRTVGTGFKANQLQDTAVDSFWTIEAADAKVNNLEMQSDLSSAFGFLQFLRESFWGIGRDIDLASLKDKIGQVTNFGLKVLTSDARSKLGEKRLLYGNGLNKINRIILELGGHEVKDTEAHWLDPLPEDSTDEVNRLKAEREMEIVSKQTAAEERGRDWDQEDERMKDEAASGDNIGARLLADFTKGQSFKPLPGQNRRAMMTRGAGGTEGMDEQNGA